MCEENGGQKKTLHVRQLPIIFTPSHTCTVSFFLLVGEENDTFDECACVKRMETQDIDLWCRGPSTKTNATQARKAVPFRAYVCNHMR